MPPCLDITTAAGVGQVRALVIGRYGRVIDRNGWETDDVVQGVLVRLVQSPPDESRGPAATWVLRLARHELHERAAAEQRQPLAGLTWAGDEPCDPADAAVAPDEPAIREEHVQAYVRAAVALFRPSSAALVEHVVRARVAGFSHAEIARRTGRSRARIRQVIARLPRYVPCATPAPEPGTTDTTDPPESGEPTAAPPAPRRRPAGWEAANAAWRRLRRSTPSEVPVRPGWLSAHQVRLIREQYVPGRHGQRALARALGLPRYTVARVLRGECYADDRRCDPRSVGNPDFGVQNCGQNDTH